MGYGHLGPPMAPGYPPMGPYSGPPPMGFGPPLGPYGYPMLPPPPGAYGGYGYAPRADSRSRSPRGRGQRGGRRRADGRSFKPHHTSTVPRGTDLAERFVASGGPPTTGMLRNIPNRYLQDALLEEIDEAGYTGTYDFFYLPMDVRNNANVGYAFINFLQNADFERFRRQFDGYQFKQFKRASKNKIAAVSQAVVQGLKANVQNLLKKRVAQGQYRPVVIRDGRRVEMEALADDLLRRSPQRDVGDGGAQGGVDGGASGDRAGGADGAEHGRGDGDGRHESARRPSRSRSRGEAAAPGA